MRRVVNCLAILAGLLTAGDPFSELLQRYADGYSVWSKDVATLTEQTRAVYPRLFYAQPSGRTVVTDVLPYDSVLWDENAHQGHRKSGGVGDEVISEFDYARLATAMNKAGGILTVIPSRADVEYKNVRIRTEYLSAPTLAEAVADFNNLWRILVPVVETTYARSGKILLTLAADSGFIAHRVAWEGVQIEKQRFMLRRALADFEARYGPQSDRVNWVEYGLMNLCPCLKGTEEGPSHWEPIARWTPVTFNATDGHPMMVAQLGVNYYFLSIAWAPLRLLNHLGLAMAAADPEGTSLFDVKLNRVSLGLVVHTGRGQVGAFCSRDARKVKIMSTLDFQVVPGLF